MNPIRPRLALVHPWLQASGGSEPVALWAAQALKDEYEVRIVTMGETRLDDLNAAYGTDLTEPGVGVIRFPIPRILEKRGDALRGGRLARYMRAHAAEYDVLLSSYNIMDFRRPGLQYISDFSFSDPLRRAVMKNALEWKNGWSRAGVLRRAYLALARRWGGQTTEGWKRNATMANSDWTRRLMAEVFGVEAAVVYPPVPAIAVSVPWERRAEGFVSIGRLVPEKRVPEMMDILDRVRKKNEAIHYHIVGGALHPSYGRVVGEKARACGDWVTLDGPLFGRSKADLLGGHRYGMTGCRHESFGIAAAEMVLAGMIVWVPASGGQVEIVDHPDLVYFNAADAADKITRVLNDPERQSVLRAHLARRARSFSTARFMDQIRAKVAEFLRSR